MMSMSDDDEAALLEINLGELVANEPTALHLKVTNSLSS